MTNRKLLFLALIVFIVQNCTSESDQTNQIDYSTLDTLQTEVALEIGETEDYLPGNLRGVTVASDGSILVGDWASVTIEQFDSDGNHVATVAEEGGGPGELSSYFRLKDIGNDTVVVSQQSLQRVYYAPGENGVYKFVRASVPQEVPDRTVNLVGPQSDTVYYARGGQVIRDIQTASKNETDYRKTSLLLAGSNGEVIKDSLHLLKSATPHITMTSGGGIRINSVPYRYVDRFLVLNDGKYLIAQADSSIINIYNQQQELEKSIRLNVKRRAVTEADLDYELGDTDKKLRGEIEDRIDEFKPPFLNVWATDNHIWLHTATGKYGKELVVLDYDGNPLGKFMLPEVDDVQVIRENRVYTIHHSTERGDLIRVYKVDV